MTTRPQTEGKPLALDPKTSVVIVFVVVDEYNEPSPDEARFKFDSLPRIVDDLRLLHELFESEPYLEAGFAVAATIRGIDAPDITRQLRALRAALAGRSNERSVLVFWSGHAATVRNELRLVTRDSLQPLDGSDGFAPADLAGLFADARPRGLFLLFDVCQAAAAAGEVFEAVAKRTMERRPDDPLVMASLFAAYPLQQAYDGAFVECLTRLLREGPSPSALARMQRVNRFPLNPRNQRLTLAEVAEALQMELDVLPPQRRRSNTWPIQAGTQPALFPNPWFRPHLPPAAPDDTLRIASLTDLDTHFMPKARGLEPGEAGWFFSGRLGTSARIVRWLDDSASAASTPLLVLAGEGGSGKSALLGRLVALSDPVARQQARSLGWDALTDGRSETVPTLGSIDAALNLRGMSTEQVMQSLGELLGHPAASGPIDPASFVAELPATRGAAQRPTTIVLDALDEARDPDRIAESLIRALARRKVRVLVGTRATPLVGNRGARDLLELLSPSRIENLDVGADTGDDIRAYVRSRLAGTPLSKALEETVEAVAKRAGRSFLFARMAVSALLRAGAAAVASPLDWIAKGVGDALRRELEVLDDACARAFGRNDRCASGLFAALAWGYGAGLPLRDELWQLAAAALAGLSDRPTEAQAAWLLREGGRYIIEVGDGTQATYRLFHETLAEEMQAWSGPPAAAHAALANVLGTHAGAARGWARANPYAVRYAAAHQTASLGVAADRAGALEWLLCSFDWMQAKLELDGAYVLLDDFAAACAALTEQHVGGGPSAAASARNLERVLRQSAPVLARDARQLAAQLIARIEPPDTPRAAMMRPAIQTLLRDAARLAPRPSFRPLAASFRYESSRRWLRPKGNGTMTPLAFSRNGRWAVHHAANGIELWDLESWQQSGPLFSLPFKPSEMAVSDDARHVLYVGDDNLLRRWSASGETLVLDRVHSERGSVRLGVSEDGRLALSWITDGREVVFWDIETGRHEVWAAEDHVAAASLASDGSDAVIVQEDGTVWQVAPWPTRVIHQFACRPYHAIAARSADGKRLVLFDHRGQGEAWSLAGSPVRLCTIEIGEDASSAALAADGSRAAVGACSGSVFVFDLPPGPRAGPAATPAHVYLAGMTYDVGRVTFSGDRVLGADYIQIKEWEAGETAEDGALADSDSEFIAAARERIAFDTNGTAYVLAGRLLYSWREGVDRPQPVHAFGSPQKWANGLLVSAGRSPRVLARTTNEVYRFELAKRTASTAQADAPVRLAAISGDGKMVAWIDAAGVMAWSEGAPRRLRGYFDVRGANVLAVSRDGQRIVAGNESVLVAWCLELIDAGDENRPQGDYVAQVYLGSSVRITRAIFVSSRLLLLAAGRHIALLDTRKPGARRLVWFDGEHADDVTAMLATSDGRLAVTTSPFGGVTVWDVRSKKAMLRFEIGGTGFRLSEPFGRLLLSTPDGVLKMVSLGDGSTLASLQADKQFVAATADPSFERIVVCDQGGRLHFLKFET